MQVNLHGLGNWVSWQVGDYPSGRSRNHIQKTDKKTLCGISIPFDRTKTKYRSSVEVFWGHEGDGECGRCLKALESREEK